MRYISGCDPVQEMWDRDRKIARDNFGRERGNQLDLFIFMGQNSVSLKFI